MFTKKNPLDPALINRVIIVVAVVLILAGGAAFLFKQYFTDSVPAEGPPVLPMATQEVVDLEIVLENLTIPWDIAFLPSGEMLITEREGRLVSFNLESKEIESMTIDSVKHAGEGGLLGIAVHPNFSSNSLIYLYFTSSSEGKSVNRVARYRLEDNKLMDEEVVVENIPGELYHNGGRMAFGPDGLLYVATGDARTSSLAQDKNSLAGKILRVHDDGSIPVDNPFGNAVYSYGHRNPQGLTWDSRGNLWSTEHGRSGATSGLDELNLIRKGANYGWPESQGDGVVAGTVAPAVHSGPDVTWAPASALYWDGSIFFGGLRGESLYEAILDGTRVERVRVHFPSEFGRLRSVVMGPDGMFYITTSNRDGRGDINPGDDKIIRISPSQFR